MYKKREMNYLDFKFKKGDKLKVISTIRDRIYDCTFIKYEIVKDNGIIIPFGPRNFKQATTIAAKIELINEYGHKEKWRLIGENELKTLF
jgi:hypothetical protein